MFVKVLFRGVVSISGMKDLSLKLIWYLPKDFVFKHFFRKQSKDHFTVS